jgi:CheY-like chemotaxis protein
MESLLRILLVEDDEDDQFLFAEALRKIHPTIAYEIAGDGTEALSILENSPVFDFIFMDLNMPKMDGFECLRTMKANEIHQKVPVIIISTSTLKKDIEHCMKIGAAYYFTKPVHFDQLFQKIDDIITGRILLQTNEA